MESPTLSIKKTRRLSLSACKHISGIQRHAEVLDCLGHKRIPSAAFPTRHYLQTSWCEMTGLVSQAPAIPGEKGGHWATPLPNPRPSSLSFPLPPSEHYGPRWATASCPSSTSEPKLSPRLRDGSLFSPSPPQTPLPLLPSQPWTDWAPGKTWDPRSS